MGSHCGGAGRVGLLHTGALLVSETWTASDLLADLEVGLDKPLGYLPLDTLVLLLGLDPEMVADEHRRRGHEAWVVPKCGVGSGALYVYDPVALDTYLGAHVETLMHAGWPSNHRAFVARVMNDMVDPDQQPALYWVIAGAFNDPRCHA